MNNFEAISKVSVDQKIRSCAFDADGSHIALGLTDGSFMVLKTRYVFVSVLASVFNLIYVFYDTLYMCNCWGFSINLLYLEKP